MSSEKTTRRTPYYQDVEGFRIPGVFSATAYLSALRYKPKPGDFFVVTYPKCGTTWMQNITMSLFNNGEPLTSAMDYLTQSPFLELTGAEAVENMRRPGPIKIHLPFHFTPYSSEAKYVFVARNPKDCCVSFYYHVKNLPGYKFSDGTFDDFFELFINGETDFGDYFDTLLSWYEHRNDENVLFLTYEDLIKDLATNVKKVAEFMGEKYKALLESNPSLLPHIVKNTSLKSMKDNLGKNISAMHNQPAEAILKLPTITEGIRTVLSQTTLTDKSKNTVLLRKGVVGDWKSHFSEEQNARLDAKFRERTKGTDVPYLWKDCM